MSELKRHHINEVMDMHNLTRGEMGYSFVYYADEAEKEARHHKFKRCVAMAKWCEFRSRYYDLLIKVEASYLLSNPHNVHKYERKAFLSKSWRIKWLELAEKFKEAK